jgi:hypothetical protein
MTLLLGIIPRATALQRLRNDTNLRPKNTTPTIPLATTAHPRIRQSPISFLDNVFRKLSIRESKFATYHHPPTPCRAISKFDTEEHKRVGNLILMEDHPRDWDDFQCNLFLRLQNELTAHFTTKVVPTGAAFSCQHHQANLPSQ